MDERERRPESEGIVIPPRPPLPPGESAAPAEDERASENETVPIERVAPDAAPADESAPEPAVTEPAVTEPAVTELITHRGEAAPEPAAPEPAVTELISHRGQPAPEPVPEPEATTLPLPIVGAPADAPAAVPQTSAADMPKKKRRRGRAIGWSVAIVVLILAVVGVVGWFAGEAWAEKTVTATVQQQTAKALGLASGKDVEVGLTDPVLPQVLAGSLKTLDVTVPDAPIGGSTGTVKLHATGVPTRGSGTPTSADASITLSPAALQSLAGGQKDIVPGSVKVVGSNIAVTLNPAQFLSHVAFTLTFAPSVSQGQLILTPANFEVAGFDVSAETIRKRFGSLAAGILAPRTMCVASYFPKGMTLTGIQVSETAVVTDFAVDPRIATDPSLQAKGTCP